MNSSIITGRLTADPELKTTNNGKFVTSFTVAVDRYANGEKTADFIRCEAWEKVAEKLCQYKRKGDLIGVLGSLRVDRYTAQDGSDRSKTYIRASGVEFLGGRQEQTPPANTQVTFDHAPAPAEPDFDDDNLPF